MVRPALLLVVLVALPALPARAQQRHPLDAEAEKLCLASQPEAGAALLAQLYVETGDPTFIYNQGRCFQQNGKADQAIARFREYLRKLPRLSPEEQEDVQRRIAECEEMRRASAPPPLAQPGPPVAVAPPPARDQAGSTESLRRWRTVAVVTGGVALAGGVVASFATRQQNEQVQNVERDAVYDGSRDRWGERTETLQWIGYGLAGASAVTAIVLHLAIGRSTRDAGIGLSLGVDGRTATLSWRGRLP